MEVLFHGTTKENAKIILKEGFKVGTYFGRHLEDALHMGGNYIFEVLFEEDTGDYWEIRNGERIPTNRIRYHYLLKPNLIWHNKECEKRIKEIHSKEDYGPKAVVCDYCDGRGQEEYYPPFTYWRNMNKVTICKNCGGRGVLKDK